MKFLAGVFLPLFLLLTNTASAQRDRVFSSLEEASTVDPDSVYSLDLSKNKYTKVPKEIFQYKNLQELDLSKNRLTRLPNGFYFEDLRILNLTKNKFEVFPSEITKIKSLRNLLMGKNSMKIIPFEIGELENLIELDIWYNPISDLPESMTELRNLRSLDLSGLNFSKDFQKKWNEKLHWVKIEFESACDCAN